MFRSKDWLPIFYDLYPKSVTDVGYYKKMIDKVLNLRYKSATLVLDRAYFSKDNIENITSENIDFIIMAETYNKRLSSLLNKNKDKIYKNAENLILNIKFLLEKHTSKLLQIQQASISFICFIMNKKSIIRSWKI
ncbi:transposase [Mycoplasma sp. 1781]